MLLSVSSQRFPDRRQLPLPGLGRWFAGSPLVSVNNGLHADGAPDFILVLQRFLMTEGIHHS
jgi:hypothetical protein